MLFSLIVSAGAQTLSFDEINYKPEIGNFDIKGFYGSGECLAVETNNDTIFFNNGSKIYASIFQNSKIDTLFSVETYKPVKDVFYNNEKIYVIFNRLVSGMHIYKVQQNSFQLISNHINWDEAIAQGWNISPDSKAFEVVANDSVAFIAANSLFIIDIKNPNNQKFIYGKGGRGNTGGSALYKKNLQLKGENLFVSLLLYGFQVLDISNPSNPTELYYIEETNNKRIVDMQVIEDTLVVGTSSGVIYYFDIKNSPTLTSKDSLKNIDSATSLSFRNDILFISTQHGGVGGNKIFKFKKGDPVPIAKFGFADVKEIIREGDLLFSANRMHGIKAYNLTDVSLRDSLVTGGVLKEYHSFDNYSYLLENERGLRVIKNIFSSPKLIFQEKRLKAMGRHNLAQNNSQILYTYFYTTNIVNGSGNYRHLINKSSPENVIDIGKYSYLTKHRFTGFGDYFIKENKDGTSNFSSEIIAINNYGNENSITSFEMASYNLSYKRTFSSYPFIVRYQKVENELDTIRVFQFDENSKSVNKKYTLIKDFTEVANRDEFLYTLEDLGYNKIKLEKYTVRHDALINDYQFIIDDLIEKRIDPNALFVSDNTIIISADEPNKSTNHLFFFEVKENSIYRTAYLQGAEIVSVLPNNEFIVFSGVLTKIKLNANQLPVYTGQTKLTLEEDSQAKFEVSATDSDGGSITIAIKDTSENIFSYISGDELTLTPNINYFGEDSISLEIADGIAKVIQPIYITVTNTQDPPQAFEWVSEASDTINITQSNLADTYELKWSESKDVDGETINYLLYAGTGASPKEEVYDTTSTSLPIPYQEFLQKTFEQIPMLSRATVQFSVSATDGIDTVKVTGDDRVVFVNRYDYLSTEGEGIPTEFALHENYPNPFNPTTTLRFDLPEVSNLTLTIYNMLGQKVRTFDYQNTSAGYHSVTWDATNDYGEQVGAGVYLYQLRAKQFVKTRKMVLLK